MKRVFVQTFGCQMNEHDSRLMAGLLAHDGYERVDSPAGADLVIVNTCAIRDKAEHKVFSLLGTFRDLKREYPGMMIGVGGCVAQEHGAEIRRRAPYVDLVFGTQNIRNIRELVREAATARGVVATAWAPDALARFREGELPAPYGTADGVTAFVTVAEGCDHFCSFCIVPYTRGREASRSPESILNDVRALAAGGVKEVTLLGQNVNSYGKGTGYPFSRLLEAVCQTPGLARVRFTSNHPRDFTDDLIDAYTRLPGLARHLHLAVQSGSNRLLAAMNRRYDVAFFEERIASLRSRAPGVAVTTDIIVGYPGETADDFELTLGLMRRVRFDHTFAFKYSARPGTRSAALADDVPEPVKGERLQRVLDLQDEACRDYNGALVGRRVEVLVEGVAGGEAHGRTSCMRMVHFTAPGGGGVAPGSLVEVAVVKASPNALRGELCPVPV